ncbi:hypothetical protein [Gelidibacter gilvus]|uniref:Uncharacterized protein n=1 Tax=Gelidibacter gilvus TaxID=59602 RepID=A0A4Q0XK35_9FLAO|nr:hypothetical protein [Gelidibacter gilvus]RXJ50429.1 hypothetical protein ESZ48_06570 [Gelidibacter gilvus]
MKNLKFLLIIGLFFIKSYCQTNINYSNFDAWKQNSSNKKMEHVKTIYESGYIEIDNKRSTAIIYNTKLNQKELFNFTKFIMVENGHVLGFGKLDRQHMLTFIPEDKLLLLKVNDIVIMQFSLSQSDILKLKNEFRSIGNNNSNKGLPQNKVDLLVEKYDYKQITIFTSEGELIGFPTIKNNSDGKPYSIKINGSTTDNVDKISEFFSSLFNDKVKEGFTTNAAHLRLQPPYNSESIRKMMDRAYLGNSENGFRVEFNKESYVFKAEVKRRQESYVDDQGFVRRRYLYDFFIELIDKLRLAGSKSTNFKF